MPDEDGRRGHAYCLLATEIGTIGLSWSAAGLSGLLLPEADRLRTERRMRRVGQERAPPAPIERLIAALERYCRGEREEFGFVTLDLEGVNPFRRSVYRAARAIAWGNTASYGDLARAMAQPGAARAVGRALANNPFAIIVPCHRIITSSGGIGGFSAFGGQLAKRRLLALEGVSPGEATPLLPGLLERQRLV